MIQSSLIRISLDLHSVKIWSSKAIFLSREGFPGSVRFSWSTVTNDVWELEKHAQKKLQITTHSSGLQLFLEFAFGHLPPFHQQIVGARLPSFSFLSIGFKREQKKLVSEYHSHFQTRQYTFSCFMSPMIVKAGTH